MFNSLNIKTQKYSAALMTGAMLGFSTDAFAGGNTFNDYVSDTSSNVNAVPDVVAFISYLGGTALAALGVVGLKKHVEDPAQNPMKNGLAKLGFGGMLLALPTITNVMLDTTAADGGNATFTNFKGVGSIGAGSAGGG